MMADEYRPSLKDRRIAVVAKLAIAGVIERSVKLSGSSAAKERRGACPFCQGSSASFAVSAGKQFAHCFRCSWHGNVIDFVAASRGLQFIDALAECELEAGISLTGSSAGGAGPVHRERNVTKVRAREKVLVETIDMARAIWRRARVDHGAVRRYFMGRGVPAWVLSDARLAQFRFLGACPLMQWELRGADDHRSWPRDALNAPAVVAMVRKPVWLESVTGPVLDFVPTGLHITYLNPDGTGTMVRRKPWAKPADDEPLFAKRKMLGPVGRGAVLLGQWQPHAPLFVGEGNETVLSGMALASAPSEAVGMAVLSLDNLQGFPRKWNARAGGSIWPLFRIEPDPERPPFTIPGQLGAVTVLVDSDMAPLRGQKLVERAPARGRRPEIVERAITGAERAQICGELAVKGWRAAGASHVAALRAPLGMDFNDAIQGEAA